MATSITRDILINQGSRYRAIVDVSVEWLSDLIGYEARGTVRRYQTVETADDPLAVLDDYLTVDGVNSLMTIDVPANISAGWDWTRGHYDIEIFDGNPAHDVRVLQGQIRVDPEVTF